MDRVYRSRKNRVIAGVAGGLAEYFDVDVALIRILWVLALFVGGGGFIAYIIAWIVIPDEEKVAAETGGGEKVPAEMSPEMEQSSAAPGWSGDAVGDEMPLHETTTANDDSETEESRRARRRRNAGLLLVGLGLFFLARQTMGIYFHYIWPLLLIAAGVFFLVRERKEG